MTRDVAGIVLFDGVCGLCTRSVQFIIGRDSGQYFQFASLQSTIGRGIAARHGIDTNGLGTLILVEGEQAYNRSEAALRIARRLDYPWRLVSGLLVVPRFVRDPVYRFVARHRYQWFGRLEECWLPATEVEDRFL